MFNSIQKTKSIIKTIFPNSLVKKIKPLYFILKRKTIEKNRNFFMEQLQNYPQAPVWLDWKELELLHRKYPPLAGKIENHIKTSEKRSKKRAANTLSLVSENFSREFSNFLELGCGDGMVSYFLQKEGKTTTAIDMRASRFNDKAVNAGVTLLEMNAADLQFKDESFDFVFSYDGFEHFLEPELVLGEAIRLLKPGGYIYLQFEPLYMSPFGLHSWELVNIPYCHLLFPRELLQNIAGESGHLFFKNIDKALNQWSLEQFRSLWSQHSNQLKICQYHEEYDINYLNIINQYLPVFLSKTNSFDNLICNRIEVLFQKK